MDESDYEVIAGKDIWRDTGRSRKIFQLEATSEDYMGARMIPKIDLELIDIDIPIMFNIEQLSRPSNGYLDRSISNDFLITSTYHDIAFVTKRSISSLRFTLFKLKFSA